MLDGVGDPEVRTVDVDSLRVRVAVRGDGDCPLLLIMGIGGNLDMWIPFERPLRRRGLSTIAYDAPGTGASTPYPIPKRMRGMTTTVEHLLDALCRRRVDVPGVSFGGSPSSSRTSRPTGCAGSCWRRRCRASAASRASASPDPTGHTTPLPGPRILHEGGRHGVRRAGPQRSGGLPRWRDGTLRQPAFARRLSGAALRHRGMVQPRVVARIAHPTLVLAGDDDPIVPLVNARILTRSIPQARLHVLKGGGHLFLLDQPEESAEVVDFLTERD